MLMSALTSVWLASCLSPLAMRTWSSDVFVVRMLCLSVKAELTKSRCAPVSSRAVPLIPLMRTLYVMRTFDRSGMRSAVSVVALSSVMSVGGRMVGIAGGPVANWSTVEKMARGCRRVSEVQKVWTCLPGKCAHHAAFGV